MTISCAKEGYTPVVHSVASSTKGMAFGNILLGGVIGAGVDIGTGAAYDYPEVIYVPLACGPDTKAEKSAYTATVAKTDSAAKSDDPVKPVTSEKTESSK